MLALIVVIFTVLANLLIAVVVLKKNPNSATNRLVASLSIITALWTVFNFLALSPGSESIRLFWVRMVMFVTSSYGTVILLLAIAFPDTKLTLSTKSLIPIAIINLLSYGFAFSPFMFTHIQNKPDGSFNLYPGWAITFFALGFMGFMTIGFIILSRKLKSSTGILRSQLKLFLNGLIISFSLLTLTNFVAVVVFKSIQLTYLGPPFTLILFIFMVYAIIRHKFLDITAIVARAVLYTLLLAMIVMLEAGIFWLGTQILPLNVDRTIIAFAGSILIVMSYSSIRSVITDLTERIFFQGRYDEEDLLKALTSIMVSEMDVKFLELKLTKLLCQEMKVSSATFLLVSDFVAKPVPSLDQTNLVSVKFSGLEKMLHSIKSTLVFEDLTDEAYKEIFRKNNISIILPLIVGDEDIGLFVLGPKLSGDIYMDRDLEFLEIFAPQAAIALKNADSYRQIQEFNQTLELKVIDRTHELEAAQANELKLKDEFVFIATHDLATPVTAISGFTAMINDRHEPTSTELKSDLDAITEASNRLKVLVNDLLQVARSDSGTIKVDLATVDARAIIESAVRQLTPLAKEKNVTLTTSLAVNNHVQADPKKLAEIIENLLSNGIKYNKEGGSLTVTTVSKVNHLVIEFKDTGLGIKETEQSKVFTKFFRSEEPEVRQRPGTGLGLFVVRMLTEKMGGKITFKSVPGQGTTFWLEFNC